MEVFVVRQKTALKFGMSLALTLLMVLASSLAVVAQEQVTITVYLKSHWYYYQWASAAAEAFMKQYPHIKVELMHSSNFDQMVAMMAGGIAPDIFQTHSTDLPMQVSLGWTRDLDEYIAKDFDPSPYIPATLEAMKVSGRMHGLPWVWSGVAMMYNQNLFDARGVAYPDDTWTWDDLLANGRRLTFDRDGDGQIDTYGFGDTYGQHHRWPLWVWQYGGDVWNEDYTRSTLDSPEAIAALTWYADLHTVHNIAPKMISNVFPDIPTKATGDSAWTEIFENEHLAMFYATRFNRPVTDWVKIGIVPVAKGPRDTRETIFIVDNLSLHAMSEHPDEAWLFMKFLTSPEAWQYLDPEGAETALSSITDIAREQLIDSPDPGSMYWIEAGFWGRRSPVAHPGGLGIWRGELHMRNQVFYPVLRGETNMQSALIEFARQINIRIAELIAEGVTW